MIALCREQPADPAVRFVVDYNAEPADVVGSLAKLLIDLDRRRKQRSAEKFQNGGTENDQ